MILTKGASMELAEEAMKHAKHAGKIKFRPTELAMITLKKNSDFRCWRVDQGVLIVQYATDTKKLKTWNTS